MKYKEPKLRAMKPSTALGNCSNGTEAGPADLGCNLGGKPSYFCSTGYNAPGSCGTGVVTFTCGSGTGPG
jgi:hypothetical protein